MKNKIKVIFTTSIIACALMTLVVYAQRTSTRTVRSSGKSEWMMRTDDNGRGFEVRIKGKAEFNDDYSDLKSLAPNGSFRIRDTRTSPARRIEIEADDNGNLKRKYYVNDMARELDTEARQWLAVTMLDVVRQGGFDADRRVARMFANGGAQAVLNEINLIKGDYAQGLYFRHLLKQPSLDAATTERVVQQVAREISSAYEKRQTLSAVPEAQMRNAGVLTAMIAAAGTVDSDYERGQLLKVFLQGKELSEPQLQAALQVIAGIDSDYEQAEALLRVAQSQKVAASALPQLFEAIKGIDSDYEQARVLIAFLKDDNSDSEMMKRVIKASASIGSDYEQARVLMRVAALNKDNEEVRKLLVEAARTIGSDYERGRVLSATFR